MFSFENTKKPNRIAQFCFCKLGDINKKKKTKGKLVVFRFYRCYNDSVFQKSGEAFGVVSRIPGSFLEKYNREERI